MNDFASSGCHDRIADFKITQVQRDSHFDMGESHYHPYYEFYYLLSGQCRCFISHSIYRLFPGDLIMIPPSVLHRVLYETKRPAERINIFFFGRLLTPGVCRQRSGSLRRTFFPQQTHHSVFQPSAVRTPDDAPAP